MQQISAANWSSFFFKYGLIMISIKTEILFGCLIFPVSLLKFQGVQADFHIIDQWEGSTVYNLASDVIEYPCQYKDSKVKFNSSQQYQLVKANPSDACEVPDGPPSLNRNFFWRLYYSIFPDPFLGKGWILLVSDSRSCAMKTKVRNSAKAGYSGVIFGTDKTTRSIVNSRMLQSKVRKSHGGDGLVDVHLVNPFDVDVLSRKYAYPYSTYLAITSLTICKSDKSQNPPKPEKLFNFDFVNKRKNLEEGLVCGGVILWGFLKLKRWLNGQGAQQRPHWERSQQRPRQQSENNRQSERENFSNDSSSQEDERMPRRPPGPFYLLLFQRHLSNLELALDDTPITPSKVKSAYKKMALKCHPDKNSHLTKDEIDELTEKFKKVKASRDVLIGFCETRDNLHNE